MKKVNKNNLKIINIFGKYNNERILIILYLLKYFNKYNKKVLIIDLNKNVPKEYFYFKNKNRSYKISAEEKNIKKDNKKIEKIKLNNNIELVKVNKIIFNQKNNKYYLSNFFNQLILENKNKYNYIIINKKYNLNNMIMNIFSKFQI